MQQKRLIKLVLHTQIILCINLIKLYCTSQICRLCVITHHCQLTPCVGPRFSAVACLPQRLCTKNFNVKNTEREIAPLEKTSGSALAQ